MEESKTESNNTYLIPGAIVLAGVVIAGAVIYANSDRSNSPQQASVGESQPKVVGDLADDDPFLGDPNAPVTIVEFGDFQCPFCRRFHAQTLPLIIDEYVKTGKARFVYRDFPLSSIHEQAQKSAEAAECANEQGKFWPYHDLLFQRQEGLSISNYKLWAGELGLNQGQFNSCLDSGKYSAEVEKDAEDGRKAGVTGTPATFVNGRLVSGAVPFAQFKAVIEEELAKAAR